MSESNSETGRITSDRVYMILRRWGISEVDAMRVSHVWSNAVHREYLRELMAERAKAKEIV